MTIDIAKFNKINVIDSCAIWNVLSCDLFFLRAFEYQCNFIVTGYVEYECLVKARAVPSKMDDEIKTKFRRLLTSGKFSRQTLTIEDIQEVEVMRASKKLGRGELASIAYAKKIGQSVLTDDRKARTYAKEILGSDRAQTTPHLFGHLILKNLITETEVEGIIQDHNACGRPLEKYFRECFLYALQIRLMMQ